MYAHPHVCGSIAVVHNGISRRRRAASPKLIADGASLRPNTDSEIFAHLIAAHSAPQDDGDGGHAISRQLASH